MKYAIFILISLLAISLYANDQPNLSLHIIPHTHNDLGWLFSVASYYLGTNPRGCVECILNNVTQALYKDPNRRFSYVEMGYFRIWWGKQNADSKKKVKQLVENGQLEFLNSGVVMSDEGAAYYDDIIEQMTKGLKFVKDTFNYTVHTGWHIDPFGHSSAQASMFSQMGFNSWFFERIDYQDYNNRVLHKNLELLWRPKTFSDFNYVLAHVNFMSYYLAPFNWCIDMTCYPSSTPFDSMQLMFKYSTWVQNQSNFYLSNQILHHVGGDFEWSYNANRHFQGLQFVIDYLNAHPEFGIKPFFSTPGNYTNAVYGEFLANKTKPLTTKEDDFMSYVDVPHAFWTGYYTSRANFKQQIRSFGQQLQTIRKILSKALIEKLFDQSYKDFEDNLDQYEEINGILQHHDAITGTAKQKVTQNYINMIACATNDINLVLSAIVGNFTSSQGDGEGLYQECSMTKSTRESTVVYDMLQQLTSIKLTIYNPSSYSKKLVQVRVPRLELKVLDANGNDVDTDIMCDDYSQLLYCNLFFYADIPMNSFGQYKITIGDILHSNIVPALNLAQDMTFSIGNNYTFKASANLKDFVIGQNSQNYPFSLYYNYYDSYYKPNEQASGAYIFRPAHNYSSLYSKVLSGRYFKGKNLVQIQIKGDKVISSIKLNTCSNYKVPVIQVDSLTLPVDISDGIGKEITVNFLTPTINNKNIFYTDSNGLEMQKRVLNHRDTYNVNLSEPIAGNYFPVFTSIYIEDTSTNLRMTVMNDRTQGGSSLNKGEIELMIQRRILHDDDRGVDEALNETDSNGVGIQVQTTHYLFFTKDNPSFTQRQIQYDIDTQNLVFAATLGSKNFTKTPKKEQEANQNSPSLVKFYIRPYSDTNFLVRLHNLNDKESTSVDLVDSQIRPIVLSQLIGDNYLKKSVVSIVETTLSANQKKQEMLEAKFKWDGDFFPIIIDNDYNATTLGPLEMKVFNITIKSTSTSDAMEFLTTKPMKCNCNCIFTVNLDEESEDDQQYVFHSHSHGSHEMAMSAGQLKYMREIARHKKPRTDDCSEEHIDRLYDLIHSL